MKTMSIYEPAMCCSTGVCGPSIDPELLRISTVLDILEKYGIKINRYNLASSPQEFISNTVVNQILTDEGIDVLPIFLVDGEIVLTKRYPNNNELADLIGIPRWVFSASNRTSCCCGGNTGCC